VSIPGVHVTHDSIEVITSVQNRRRWSATEKQQIVRASLISRSMPTQAYALEHPSTKMPLNRIVLVSAAPGRKTALEQVALVR
jgi:hypothetical protein